MPQMYRFPPTQGPVSRFVSALILILIFTLAFFVGTVLFLSILGVLAVLFLVFYLRFWWLRRRWARGQLRAAPRSGVTLEGEYTVSERKNLRSDDAD